jgi:SAM-dependent methyltransferase
MPNFPEGYYINDGAFWGEFLVRSDGKESFRLTNRSFEQEIDHYLGYLPSQILNYLVGKNQDRPTKVLDAGGGSRSVSATEIAKKYGTKVDVTNVELLPSFGNIPEGISYAVANICDMSSIPSISIDFAYSYQVLPNFEEGNEKQLKAHKEIARILAPGGAALVPDRYFSRMPILDPRVLEFGMENNVEIILRYGNISEKGKYTFGAPWKFPMILKRPVDYNFFRIQPKLIGQG